MLDELLKKLKRLKEMKEEADLESLRIHFKKCEKKQIEYNKGFFLDFFKWQVDVHTQYCGRAQAKVVAFRKLNKVSAFYVNYIIDEIEKESDKKALATINFYEGDKA